MAYNEFTFDMLEEQFGLTVTEVSGLFASTQPLPLTDYFRMQLARHRPLVVGVDTEKVRSELLIAPMLVELREQVAHSVGLFSGAEFNVDRESGLVGFCDFLVSRTPGLVRIGVPVLTVVEAKRESLTGGLPQCIAEMYAALLFNQQRGAPIPTIYGVVTTGTAWRFLQLTGTQVTIDIQDYYIDDAGQILGILVAMVRQATPLAS